jgi:murein DD-endopeptidase MepM/ murein hydrolase activator NlpD
VRATRSISAISATAIILALAACGRSGPPAPVQYATPPIALPANVAGNGVSAAPGDTVFSIARRRDVPVRDLIEANGLVPPYRLSVGQSLVIPSTQTHLVQPGETIYTVSRRYGVDTYELARANNLAPPYALYTGGRLRVPRGGDAATTTVAAVPPRQLPAASIAAPAPKAPPAVTVAPLPAPEASSTAPQPATAVPPAPQAAIATPPPEAPADPPPRAGRGFLWPVQGTVVSRYGPKPGGLQNDGINIAAPRGTTVRAAESGTVVYAGNELRGFGNLLLIRHADGWVSAYAHADQLLVERGAQVTRGQAIAKVGTTGSVSEPQLHFELRQGVNAVDPLRYLAKGAGPAISQADGPSRPTDAAPVILGETSART